MSNPSDKHPSDDDLLADAIPIPKDDDDDLEVLDDGIDHELDPIDPGDLSAGDMDPAEMTSTKIQAFGGRKVHVDHWQRTPNVTGTGAIHMKTFVAKLRLDAMDNLDDQVNEWLDNHPEYEVKFVTTTIGTLKSKLSEPALFMNVWV